jgi:hypothetical protein
VEEFFFPTSRLTQEWKKFEYRRATYKIRRGVFFVLRVAQVKKAKDSFYKRATYKGKYKEAVESARAGLSPKKGDVRKKRKEKKKDQGRWSVATRREREKEEKKKDQGRREGGSREGKVPCALNQEFLFWFTSIWVWKQPVLFEVSAPTRLSLRESNVRTKSREWTTLHSESSTLKGLLFAGRCELFVARKVRTIAGAKREQESCHLTSDNQLLFTSWISSSDSIVGLYCVAWLTQESVSSRIFVRRK